MKVEMRRMSPFAPQHSVLLRATCTVLGVARELTCREMVKLVTDYLERRLSPDELERFEQHLAVCDGCQAYVEQMRETLSALGEFPEDRLSVGARDTLLAAFRSWSPD
jgi:Putative zinc-finger